jgi:hypothetical protein
MRKGGDLSFDGGWFRELVDKARSGLILRTFKVGRASGHTLCTSPAIGTFAELNARDDIKALDGAMAVMTDIGTRGSAWVVRDGAWVPDGPIQSEGAPEGVIAAPVGSVYERLDPLSAHQRFYRKVVGTGNTGWVLDTLGAFYFESTDLEAAVGAVLSGTNPRSNMANPWGAGRVLKLASALHTWTAGKTIHTANSLISEAGSGDALIEWNGYPPPGGPYPGGPSGILNIGNERLLKDTVVARGEWRHIEIHGRSINNPLTLPENLPFPVHGVYAPETENGIIQSMDYVRATGCAGDGFHVHGRDQFITRRLKAGNNRGWGANLIDVGDSKWIGTGLSGGSGDSRVGCEGLGALRMEHCATLTIAEFDFFVDGQTFNQNEFVVKGLDMINGRFAFGEMSGRVGFFGRNHQSGANKDEASHTCLEEVVFKMDRDLARSWVHTREAGQGGGVTETISAYIYNEGMSGLDLILPKFGGINPDNSVDMDHRSDYLIQFGHRGSVSERGFATIKGGSGLCLRISPPGAVKPTAVAMKKHWANDPMRVRWNFVPGAVEEIWWNDDDPPLGWVLCAPYGSPDPVLYTKAEYPWGYLLNTLHKAGSFGTLDDAETHFEVRPAPSGNLPNRRKWAVRVLPF